jgi:hypothetical protein
VPSIEQDRLSRFDVGEEVLVRLVQGSVIEIEDDTLVLRALPDWMIAEVLEVSVSVEENAYRVEFLWDHASARTWVRESDIEGTV